MLHGEGLWLRHRTRGPWVLRDVAVSVEAGEVVGIQGPSGCGKTTLARVLAGLVRPSRGSVSVDGQPLPERGRQPVQLVQQHPERAMNPRWRIRDVLAEASAAPGAPGVPDGVLAGAAEGLVEEGWADRHPHELSGGELQRVNLARALRADPRYLVLDEISSSLDPLAQADLWQCVAETVRARGVGVLVISHDRLLLGEICDRVLAFDAVQGGADQGGAVVDSAYLGS